MYRNNVVAGLIDAVRDTFPAVCRIVGRDFFDAMARVYVMAHPPRSPILLKYGDNFADFIRTFSPIRELPYLADVAAIEYAWLKAYHAIDRQPLDRSAFLTLKPEQAPQLQLVLHPSSQVLRSPFPALTIWQMNTASEDVKEISLADGGEDTFILRVTTQVEVRPLMPGGAIFLNALAEEETLSEATGQARDAYPDFDPGAALSGLIEAGAVVAFRFANEELPQESE